MNFFPVFRDLFRGYSSAVFNEFFVKNQKVYKSANRVGRKNPGNLASLVKALKSSYLSSPNATHLVGKKMSIQTLIWIRGNKSVHANGILYRIESLRFKTVRYTTGYYSINQSIQTCRNADIKHRGGGRFLI